ncbi:uncharacterized protein ACA1_113570 [Acanthamoeba castellanii str. Neff]|uniref:Uncharacterized protein n=1 Tax=Acanthamoeba castellanii (strain ATCC 30010 / Neff) TaxID=1257118 RepID=L8H478_ACACF|nr:uncharacterized protein ACA1_113570 [Acanthamoeba castellanii str. Neff]ELR20012.1 hypothetical protein ACA1_113570 [Acanthamoeba castellanii str. Neff]
MARRGFEKEQAAIVNLEFVIQEHITHLHNEPLASLQEINGQNHDAKALLKQLHACLKSLEQAAVGQDSERDTAALLEWLRAHQTEYNKYAIWLHGRNGMPPIGQRSSRVAKQLSGGEKTRTRQLISGGLMGLLLLLLHRAAEDAAKAQESITSTLRRTRQKMGIFGYAQRDIAPPSGLWDVTHGLLAKLKRRECTDMLLVLFGVFFFLSVVLYISLDRLGLLGLKA